MQRGVATETFKHEINSLFGEKGGKKKVKRRSIEEIEAELERIIVSAGKIGMQLKLSPGELLKVTNGQLADLTVGDE